MHFFSFEKLTYLNHEEYSCEILNQSHMRGLREKGSTVLPFTKKINEYLPQHHLIFVFHWCCFFLSD